MFELHAMEPHMISHAYHHGHMLVAWLGVLCPAPTMVV